MLQWKNSTTFFACPIDAGKEVWNVYTTFIDAACAEIVLGIEAAEFCPAVAATTTGVSFKTTLTLTVPPGRATASTATGSVSASASGFVPGNAAVGMRDGTVRGLSIVAPALAVMLISAFVF